MIGEGIHFHDREMSQESLIVHLKEGHDVPFAWDLEDARASHAVLHADARFVPKGSAIEGTAVGTWSMPDRVRRSCVNCGLLWSSSDGIWCACGVALSVEADLAPAPPRVGDVLGLDGVARPRVQDGTGTDAQAMRDWRERALKAEAIVDLTIARMLIYRFSSSHLKPNEESQPLLDALDEYRPGWDAEATG